MRRRARTVRETRGPCRRGGWPPGSPLRATARLVIQDALSDAMTELTLDLAPGRSLAEYLAGSGLQVFVMSWRNPDSRHARWDFDTYGQAVLDAMDAVARITGTEQTAITGVCSGGIIAAMVAAHLAHTGRQDQIAALTLMVTVLDQARAGLGSAVISGPGSPARTGAAAGDRPSGTSLHARARHRAPPAARRARASPAMHAG